MDISTSKYDFSNRVEVRIVECNKIEFCRKKVIRICNSKFNKMSEGRR